MKLFFIIFIIFIFNKSIYSDTIGQVTGYQLPRFVSLKTNESNLRVGPSLNYPIKIKYLYSNIPIEIIKEYKDWRKVNDFEGNEGWMHKRLLSGKRYALILPPYNASVQIYTKPEGALLGKIGGKNIVELKKCLAKWCYVIFKKNKGWVIKSNLWGVYKNENYNIPFYQPLINYFWKIDFKFL